MGLSTFLLMKVKSPVILTLKPYSAITAICVVPSVDQVYKKYFITTAVLVQWDHMEIIGKTIPEKGVREGKYNKRSVG